MSRPSNGSTLAFSLPYISPHVLGSLVAAYASSIISCTPVLFLYERFSSSKVA